MLRHEEGNGNMSHPSQGSAEAECLDGGSGDYAERLEEVLGGNEDDEEEEFLYQGEDSQEVSGTYNERLQTVIQGLDDTLGTDLEEERQVEEQLKERDVSVDDLPKVDALDERIPSVESSPFLNFLPEMTSTMIDDSLLRGSMSKSFLNPKFSRLRSLNPAQRQSLMSSVDIIPSGSQSPSHFSTRSRSSSILLSQDSSEPKGESFHWEILKDVGHYIFSRKATSTLGAFHGSPTVLTTNGLICIGTDRGRVLVFDFQQHLRCVCGTDVNLEAAGPVSALSLSHDHTYVAVGHTRGYINLYDLSRPQSPARSVPATSLSAVASGRMEGHIEGSRILSIGFVGARHTAIVSADECGLAFYHSLGKVLFVEANDTLRILGKYPDQANNGKFSEKITQGAAETSPRLDRGGETVGLNPPRPRPWKPRKGSTILAMGSLPLGTTTNPMEAYNLVALLTPAKLVIVGLKPFPRTWFRRHRQDAADIPSGASKWRGCAAWFPSVDAPVKMSGSSTGVRNNNLITQPVLAYTWDRTLYVLRVSEVKRKQVVQSTKNPGKLTTIEVGKITTEEVTRWSSESDYLAIQWLNVNLLLALTDTFLEVWDVRTSQRMERLPFSADSLLSCPDSEEMPSLAHSMRVYKGRVFLLGRRELTVGTLLSWADRILKFVNDGDFLNAIETARCYYLGIIPKNWMALPNDSVALRNLVGKKMYELVTSSAHYAFAKERMTDRTHVTPDGRGVDRTSLFEDLVTVCTKASIALEDYDFLFEDLFDEYEAAGITPIFLARLEPFVLDGALRSIPPRITQRLIGIHQKRGELDKAERLIWHIDPDCLDINQAITLCRGNGLYDALIYVYTRSLHDFVTPIVELLELVRQVQRRRRAQTSHFNGVEDSSSTSHHRSGEYLMADAYKIYSYLGDVLSGLTYPSQIPLPSDESLQAKNDVYHFLFKGLPYAPTGIDRLIFTSDEEGGAEQTYPYVRLLLQFDAEAFLNVLDMAFEDGYFNRESPVVDRLVVVRILLEVLSTPGLSSPDTTMLNIFIARNVPKYPQSIYIAPSILHDILVGLTEDPDRSTREDRQLAAEYIISVYTPHDSDKMMALFDNAGFFRILRSWLRQDHKWGALLSTYLRDPDTEVAEVFHSIDEVLTTALHDGKGTFSDDVLAAVTDAIPRLLDLGITETAVLIDKHTHALHTEVLEILGNVSPQKQFTYLRCLLEPSALRDDPDWIGLTLQQVSPSPNLSRPSRELHLKLLCQLDPFRVIPYLETLDEGYLDWDIVVSICEQHGINEAVIWIIDKRGDSEAAFRKLEHVSTCLTLELSKKLAPEMDSEVKEDEVLRLLDELKAVGTTGLRICHEHSAADEDGGVTIEEMWLRLLRSQIDTVQAVSNSYPLDLGSGNQEQQTLESLRASVQTTFTSLMRLGSSSVLSFPRLFKKLVDSTSSSRSSSRSSYSEFRLILAGMLDSYRSEGDLLVITNRLVERDLFVAVKELARCRERGSKVRGTFCASCGNLLQDDVADNTSRGWFIQRLSGFPYHSRCLPSITDIPDQGL